MKNKDIIKGVIDIIAKTGAVDTREKQWMDRTFVYGLNNIPEEDVDKAIENLKNTVVIYNPNEIVPMQAVLDIFDTIATPLCKDSADRQFKGVARGFLGYRLREPKVAQYVPWIIAEVQKLVSD